MTRLRFILCICLVLPCLLAAEITVNARFNPPRVALGNPVRYVVEIVETSDGPLASQEPSASFQLPDTGALSLRNLRTSESTRSEISLSSGSGMERLTTTTRTISHDVIAPRPGEFEIPSFSFTYKGERLRVPAARLTVVERGEEAGPTGDDLIFLQAAAPLDLWIGQTAALDLKLYVEESARLSDLHQFERLADGFTVTDLPREPDDTMEIVNGRRYRVLTWPLAVTPIRTGMQELGFQFSLSALLPSRERNDPFGRRSPFGQSVFENFFSRPERLNVYTDPMEVEVKPLPESGRPSSFGGAIGEFSMEVASDSRTAEVGEPIMLSVSLSGQGNFERIQAPALPETEAWRVYDPEAQFEASDELGLSGRKRFDYVVVPQKSGRLELPPVRFAYFDPASGRYVERSGPAIPVEVAPSASPTSAPSIVPDSGQTEPAADSELRRSLTTEEALLLPDHRPRPGRRIDSNLLSSPWFAAANALALAALAAAAFLLRRQRRLRADADFALMRRAGRELRAARAEAKAAAETGDADRFYREAQRALRLWATRESGRDLRNADLSEIEPVLRGRGRDESVREKAAALFEAGDACRFSGRKAGGDLSASHRQLESILSAR